MAVFLCPAASKPPSQPPVHGRVVPLWLEHHAGAQWAAHHRLSCSYINISALGPWERQSGSDLSALQPSFQYYSLNLIKWQDNQMESAALLTSWLTSNFCLYRLNRAKQHHSWTSEGSEKGLLTGLLTRLSLFFSHSGKGGPSGSCYLQKVLFKCYFLVSENLTQPSCQSFVSLIFTFYATTFLKNSSVLPFE